MVKIRCSASDRIRVPARPAQHVHRRVPGLRRRTRWVHLPSEAGTPDMTLGRADADQAGARPYLRRCAGTPRKRIRFDLIRNKSLPVSPLLERFLDSNDSGTPSPRLPIVHEGNSRPTTAVARGIFAFFAKINDLL